MVRTLGRFLRCGMGRLTIWRLGSIPRCRQGGSAGEVLVKQSATDYDSAWEVLFGQVAGSKPTRWEHPPGTNTTLTLTDGTFIVTPIFFVRPVTLDRIAVRVTTAGSAGSVIRLGIYSADAAMFPSTLVLDAGTVDSSSTGTKEITISQALPFGVYWLGAVGQATPASNPVVAARTGCITPTLSESSNSQQNAQGGLNALGVTGALASTYGFDFGTANTARPAVAVRIA
jgi:hypothetical protein